MWEPLVRSICPQLDPAIPLAREALNVKEQFLRNRRRVWENSLASGRRQFRLANPMTLPETWSPMVVDHPTVASRNRSSAVRGAANRLDFR